MRNVRSFLVLALSALVGACSSGGSSTSGAPSVPKPSAPGQTSGTRAQATFKLTIPAKPKGSTAAHVRRPAYISPASLGAILIATSTDNSANDESYGYNLSTTGACTSGDGGTISCTLNLPLYADTYSVAVKLYDKNEDGVTPGAGSPSAPAGNELSTDTETETVVLGSNNSFTNLLLHAIVASFNALPPQYTGAAGGAPLASPAPAQYFAALDADGFNVDDYGNATTYANAPLAVTETDLGDASGCTSACTSGTNAHGTSPSGTPAAIAGLADMTLTLGYTGGGGPGAGVKTSTGGSAPTGQHPYEGDIRAVAPSGGANSADTYVVPLFGYPATLGLTSGSAGYVWAAQAHTPNGANASTGSYSAYFGTPGTSACTSVNGTVATIGAGTYFAGYGEVYPITPGVNGTCTVTLSDGGTPADTVSVTIAVGPPGSTVSVPCAQGTVPPTGSSVVRRRAVTGAPPTLVQYAVGVSSATLPNPVTAGDTLVVIIGDNPGSPQLSSSPIDYTPFANASDGFGYVYTADVPSTQNIGSLASGDGCNTAMWIGEFAGSSSASIQSANAAGGGDAGEGGTPDATTASIVPNAQSGLVITSFVSDDTAAATASTGYTEYFAYGPQTSLDVQLANSPTTDTTDPVSNTFAGVADPNGFAEIFQIPPSTFMGSASTSRSSAQSDASRYRLKKLNWLRVHRH